jgi:hypothetical protein
MNYDTVCDFAQTPSTKSLQELEGRNHEDTRMSPLGVEPLSAERLAATKVTTMNAESDPVPQREILPEMSCIACPLHVAMEKIAHSAVQQCVLYLQGECQPRPTLLQELDDWISLHALIRSRICVASRTTPISSDDLDAALNELVPVATDSTSTALPQLRRQNLRDALAACIEATSCPLGA